MKKIISVLTVFVMALSLIALPVSAQTTTIVMHESLGLEANVSGFCEILPMDEDYNQYNLIDSNSKITFSKPVDSIYIYMDEFEQVIYSTELGIKSDFVDVKYTEKTRIDSKDPYSKEAGNETVTYYTDVEIRFYAYGKCSLSADCGFETAEERINALSNLEEKVGFLGYTQLDVIPAENEEIPVEEMPEEMPKLYTIEGVTGVEERFLGMSEYSTSVTKVKPGGVLTIEKDLMNFTAIPYDEAEGVLLNVPFLELDGVEVVPREDGLLPAKKGNTLTFKLPGLYELWGEDYEGNVEGYIIDVEEIEAIFNESKVMLNGKEVKFDSYNIFGNNYFKLRDIAAAVNGTAKQFAVNWDAEQAMVSLNSKTPYTPVGGELALGDGINKMAGRGTGNIIVDSMPFFTSVYMINGNNYFMLRDLGIIFDFDVTWDEANRCILIDTSSPYMYH